MHFGERARRALQSWWSKGPRRQADKPRRTTRRLFTIDDLEQRSLLSAASLLHTTGPSKPFAAATPRQTYDHFEISIGNFYVYPMAQIAAGPKAAAVGPNAYLYPFPFDDQVRTGVQTAVTLSAVTSRGIFDFNYSGKVQLKSSDAGATFTSSEVTFDHGYASTQITFAHTGRQTVTAVDVANAKINGTGKVVVAAPLVATHFGVTVGNNYWPIVYAGGPVATTAAPAINGPNTSLIAWPFWNQRVRVGTAANIQLVALDAKNRFVSTYTGTVDLSSSDAQAGFSNATVTFVAGRAASQVTFAAAGKQTITAVDKANAQLTGTGTIDVLPVQVVTHFAVTVGSGIAIPLVYGAANSGTNGASISLPYFDNSIRVGTPTWVSVVALDDTDTPVWNYGGSVNLSSSDSGAKFSTNPLQFSFGYAFTSVTFQTAGKQTVTATQADASSVVGSTTVNVQPLPTVTHFGVLVGGILSVFPTSAGTGAGGTGPTSIKSLPGSGLTNFINSLLPRPIRVGTPTTVRIVALDAKNRPVPSYSGTVNLSSSDPGATFSSPITFANGYASGTVTFSLAGQQTVTATDTNDATLLGSTKVNVAAQTPSPTIKSIRI
jgi:hypothetical protein